MSKQVANWKRLQQAMKLAHPRYACTCCATGCDCGCSEECRVRQHQASIQPEEDKPTEEGEL